jgi:DnaJ domain
MAAADPGGPGPDLYQLLGVSRGASREDIAQAWRRRARSEHPDSRPGDASAPSRFRALAGAWHVLGDPARRAAYDRALPPDDRALPPGQTPPPASRPRGPAAVTPAAVTPAVRIPGPPLWAGPVRVQNPHLTAGPARRDEDELRLAVLAGLLLRSLAQDRDWPW